VRIRPTPSPPWASARPPRSGRFTLAAIAT
jgi:hypothetical protein